MFEFFIQNKNLRDSFMTDIVHCIRVRHLLFIFRSFSLAYMFFSDFDAIAEIVKLANKLLTLLDCIILLNVLLIA